MSHSRKRETTNVVEANLSEQKVFTSIPKYGRRRIFGTENEYGVVSPSWSMLPAKPGFIENGGRVYDDCNHIEYATPETSNPLEAVIYNKAGERICQKFAHELYKNNIDSEGRSFGAHENYFTKMNMDLKKQKYGKNGGTIDLSDVEYSLLPFLITRQVYAGAGMLSRDETYFISQKSHTLSYIISKATTADRGILNIREEHHAKIPGWRRWHLILGDANMSEVAEFLKIGTTGLVIDLAEDLKLPKHSYSLEFALADVKQIARLTEKWKLQGCSGMNATEMQRTYLEAATGEYRGRDLITDSILDLWSDTLEKLDRNPEELIGRVDWVTKKAVIDQYAAKNNLRTNDPRILNIDLQYHDTNPRTSLFYALQNAGRIERLVTDELIERATIEPPLDTRAYVRGKIISKRNKQEQEGENKMKNLFRVYDWSSLIQSASDRKPCPNCGGYHDNQGEKEVLLNDPFNTYESLIGDMEEKT